MTSRRTRWFILGGLALALALAFGASRYASSQPDGLEKVAAEKGLDSNEKPHALTDGPFADYETRGIHDPRLRTGVAGVVGVVITFVLAGGAVWIVAQRRRSGRAATTTAE